MGQTCCIIHCTYFWVLKCVVCWCVWDAKESAVYLCLFPILYGTMSGKIISLKWRAVGMPRHEKGGERPTPRQKNDHQGSLGGWYLCMYTVLVVWNGLGCSCWVMNRCTLSHRWCKINIDLLHPYIECLATGTLINTFCRRCILHQWGFLWQQLARKRQSKNLQPGCKIGQFIS